VKALDTNVLVRFLLADDKGQALRVKRMFEAAEHSGERFKITTPVLLEMIWVLSAVYELTRDEVLHALELLAQMPILEFESYDDVQRLIRLGRSTRADLSDLLIGVVAQSGGCDVTLTFEKGLQQTELFEQL
jgi:predicted nucleic-acid-binding protein